MGLCSSLDIYSFGEPGIYGHVQDPSNILNSTNKDQLSRLIDSDSFLSKQLYPCNYYPRPYEIAIAVINYAKYYNSSNVETLAKQIYKETHIGNPHCDNGILVFVSFGDGYTTIIKGRGIADDILSDKAIKTIVSIMNNNFLVGKEFEGINTGTSLLIDHIIETSNMIHEEYIDFVLTPVKQVYYPKQYEIKNMQNFVILLTITATFILVTLGLIFYNNQEVMYVVPRKITIVPRRLKKKKIKRIKKCIDMKKLFRARSRPSFKNVKIIGDTDTDIISQYINVTQSDNCEGSEHSYTVE